MSAASKGLFVIACAFTWMWTSWLGDASGVLAGVTMALAIALSVASSTYRRGSKWRSGTVRLLDGERIEVTSMGHSVVVDRKKLASVLVVDRGEGMPAVVELDEAEEGRTTERVALAMHPEQARVLVAHLDAKSPRAVFDLGDPRSRKRLVTAIIAATAAVAFAWLLCASRLVDSAFTAALMFVPLTALTLYEALRPVTVSPRMIVGRDGVDLSPRAHVSFNELTANGSHPAAGELHRWIEQNVRPHAMRGFEVDDPRLRSAIEHAVRVLNESVSVSPARRAAYRGENPSDAERYRVSAGTSDEAVDILRSAVSSIEERIGAVRVLVRAGVESDEIEEAIEAASNEKTASLLSAARVLKK